ncbi:MAG: DUF87 domain-containing protein [Ruminococcus sp.]|nr:DUF87 domain-containing protein [Ruminococcus sp.]
MPKTKKEKKKIEVDSDDLKNQASVIMQKPTSQLTKEDKKVLNKRISEIKKYANDSETVQYSLPYMCIYKTGICQLTKNFFSMTVQFQDANYEIADFDERNNIFEKYCSLLNTFDNTTRFQLTFENQNRSRDKIIEAVQIPEQDDDFNDIRKEYSEMLTTKLLSGNTGQSTRKFLTFGVEAKDYKEARSKLESIKSDVIRFFKGFGVESQVLNGKSRLETLYYSLNPFSDKPFVFDWDYMLKTGMDTKDFISPPSMKFNKQNFEIGDAYGQVWGLNILAEELSDEILKDFLELEELFCVNIHVQPIEQAQALKFIRRKLTDVNEMKINEQKKAFQNGYDSDILPPQIQQYVDTITDLIEKLNGKDEKLFHISISVRNYAKSKKQLKRQSEVLKRIVGKNNCTIYPYDYRQEQTLMSTLPLGYKNIPTERDMHTSGIGIFVPFTTKELFSMEQGATYYGVNTLSGGMIRANRSELTNPNGLILGTPGSGKSFSVKREILDSFLTTTDDIIICDPEGEYFPLVNALHGQVVKISSSSGNYINPMDIPINADFEEENPIAMKSDFLASVCEIIVGGRDGLLAEEHSIIDICVNEIYNDFLCNNPTQETMPTMTDLYNALKSKGDIALRLVNSLEMYVNGSQNLFNHQTNIDMNNRIICFDIKDLGSQLKKLSMLILQETVWNRVSSNRSARKKTRYYIDEFHLLLKDEQTATYSAEIWKRFRKWGGIPTGITQNVKDLLESSKVENIFENSEFIYMLNQAAGDREILGEKLHISEEQLEFVENSGQGQGLIRFGNVILPFTDTFPTDTEMYRLMTTKPLETLT